MNKYPCAEQQGRDLYKFMHETKAPKRDATTMGEAIALSSPNGRMSKRARKAAIARLANELWPDGFPQPMRPQISERDNLLQRAKELRDLAARGMHPRSYVKEAIRLEALAAQQ